MSTIDLGIDRSFCSQEKPSRLMRRCLERDTAQLPKNHPCRDCTPERRFDVLNQLTARELGLFEMFR